MNNSVLELRHFGIAFGEKEILTDVNLSIMLQGITVLIGPAGTGKSTLLRTLSGINSASPSHRTWGEALYLGEPLPVQQQPVLVAQKAKLMMATVRENIIYELPERQSLTVVQQKDICARLLKNAGMEDLINKLDDSVIDLSLGVQRHLAILRSMVSNPKLILVDEPTADIEEADCERIITYLKRESERRAVLIVVHNQKHARKLGGMTALLAGGSIHEARPTALFFSSPQTQAAKDFVRTGSCCVPMTVISSGNDVNLSQGQDSSDTSNNVFEEEASAVEKPATKVTYVSDAYGPRNFLWLKKGLLAGTPRPGLLVDLDYDLKALHRVGVRVLISLTTKPIDPVDLKPYNITGIWFPIIDMRSPEIEAARTMCEKVELFIQDGLPVAYHCRAGMGRTGTMLAAQLIWEGASAMEALEMARKIEPRWVQSENQVDFLNEFYQAVQICAKPNKPSTTVS